MDNAVDIMLSSQHKQALEFIPGDKTLFEADVDGIDLVLS